MLFRSTCESYFADGSEVTLIPAATAGSKLDPKRWLGCDSVDEDTGECTLTLDADRVVSATFIAEPAVSATAAAGIGATTASLNAKVNPRGEQTTWHFEYVDDATYGVDQFTRATKAPLSDASAGAGTADVSVSRTITGLKPGTLYHFRLVADNFASADNGTPGPEATFTTYAAASAPGLCDNDEFRTGASAKLPDCRAYEQASPVDKNGQEVHGYSSRMAASDDGKSVLYFALNGQAAGGGPQGFPYYIASRGGNDWSAQSVLPPLSYGNTGGPRGWLPDLSAVFLGVSSLDGSGGNFLARPSDGGSLMTISAKGSNSTFVGANADGSIAYFSGSSPLSSDAVVGKNNVFAWNRDTNTLALAGVLPDSDCGSPLCKPAGGSAVRVGDPGAGPFDNPTSNYPVETHAVSEAGDAYFNDAGTGQLYLRKDPFGTPSTVHVSASQRTEPDLTLPATFQAATPDGEQAFFTSREELTDESNTTPPQDPPGIGSVELPDPLASPPCDAEPCNVDKSLLPLLNDAPAGIAADTEHLYWASPSTDSIGRSDLDGDEADAEFISGADNPQDVTVDSGKIYWTNAANGQQGEGMIGRADLNGPGPASNVVQDCITGAWYPRGIDVEGSYAYWTNATDKPYPPVGSLATTSVGRADISSTCAAARTDADQLFKENLANGDIAVTATHIYLSFQDAGGTGGIGFFNIADGSPAGPAPSAYDISLGALDAPAALASDGSHLYWTHRDANSTIGRANFDGSGIDDTFVTGLTAPTGIAVGTGADAGHLYWSTIAVGGSRGKDLYRYDAGSGDLTDLTYAPDEAFGAEVRGVLGASDDGSYVYFVANADLDGDGPAATGNCTGSSVGAIADSPLTDFSGQCSVYLWYAGETSFVARLDTGGRKAEQSDAANWIGVAEFERQARVSADGTLLFRSQRALTGYDNEGARCERQVGKSELQPGRCPEFYRYQPDTGLSCVTCNPTGAAPSGPARVAEINFGVPTPGVPMRRMTRSLSADGNRVFFETPDKLVNGDVNGDAGCPQVLIGNSTGASTVGACLDVYLWEAEGVGSCRSADQNGGCLYLLSTGTGPEPSFLLDASSSGEDAFIFSRERLVPQDKDDLFDVYDVKVEGGLASQHATAPAQCAGDACRGVTGSPSGGPASAGPGTQFFHGPGNQAQAAKPRRCPRGKRKVKRAGKVRCVKRHHRKHAKHRRAQRRTNNHNGRAGR